MTKVKQFLTDS